MTGAAETVSVDTATRAGSVSGLLLLPKDATALYVMAHGAGAGMRHRFMEAMAAEQAGRGIGTLRYQLPYMETGQKRPDSPSILLATVRAAITRAAELAPGLPLFAGGKSMGGRMTSGAAAESPLPGVKGLVFLGFPLHQPGKPSVTRAEHLAAVPVPMLFIQGTRDSLADLDLVRTVLAGLPRATLHVVDGGDHSFAVPKRSGRTGGEVLADLAGRILEWTELTAPH
jgi:predicted alpha/beta-hydrolase family hydrolase